jgi:cytochrome c
MRSPLLLTAAALALGLGAQTSAMAQDAAAGERIFNQCRACHQMGEAARVGVGPPLNGLFAGRKKGSWPGYTYSAAYQALKDQEWTEENFRVYIKDPRGVTPGTKMVYAGLKDDTQITNLIAFLKQFGPDGKRTQ